MKDKCLWKSKEVITGAEFSLFLSFPPPLPLILFPIYISPSPSPRHPPPTCQLCLSSDLALALLVCVLAWVYFSHFPGRI